MMQPAVADLFRTIEATWPPVRVTTCEGWTVPEGHGGGQRVSAATAHDETAVEHLAAMEQAQRDVGQRPLVMVRSGEDSLDAHLEAAGYTLKDRTLVLTVSTETLADSPAPLATYPVWPPLAAQLEIWSDGGVGPERVAVMERASGAKTAILGRLGDELAATAFVACHGEIAMLHALEVAPDVRRKGVGSAMMRAAGAWAKDAGAAVFSVLVVEANEAAVALYSKLGFEEVAAYHYRRAPELAG